jgi:LysM repeat protein
MSVPHAHVRRLVVCVVFASFASVSTATAAVPLQPPTGDFSPAFLGMYRKIMRIDAAIDRYSRQYHVDPLLARAVCMFESGGNPDVTSGAGAHGYFQVMPSTFRLMHVPTNIEAGIKYLSQLIRQFGREDYALAAYNGGPGRVARGRAMPLESLQYVLGVGYYRSVLKMYEPAVRAHASALALATSRTGDDWDVLSDRLHVPAVYLRLYNPFVTESRLRRGTFQIAYPIGPVPDLFAVDEAGVRRYRARIGDNYINLAVALGVDVDRMRDANELWRLQVLPADMVLTIPAEEAIAAASAHVEPASTPAVRRAVAPPATVLHRVRRGETLSSLARRYRTSVRALQRANALGRRTAIRAGERLRIPDERHPLVALRSPAGRFAAAAAPRPRGAGRRARRLAFNRSVRHRHPRPADQHGLGAPVRVAKAGRFLTRPVASCRSRRRSPRPRRDGVPVDPAAGRSTTIRTLFPEVATK